MLHKANYEKMRSDIHQEVSKHADVLNYYIVTLSTACIAAEAGSVFFELPSEKDAENVVKALNGRVYERREIKICCVPSETYQNHIKPSISG